MPDAPAADVPGGRRRRRGGRRAARTSTALKAPLRPDVRAGDRRGRRRSRADRDRPDHLDLRHHRADVRADPRPATRCAAIPALVDEGATVGLRVFGSEAEQDGRAPARRTTAAAADGCRHRSRRSPTGLDNAEQAGAGRVAVPLGRRAARRLPRCGRGALVDRHGPVRDEPAFDALAARLRAGAGRRHPGGAGRRAARCWRQWRDVDKALSGRAEMAMLPALADMRRSSAGWCTAASSPRPGPRQLRRYPRYLAAVGTGRERLPGAGRTATGS